MGIRSRIRSHLNLRAPSTRSSLSWVNHLRVSGNSPYLLLQARRGVITRMDIVFVVAMYMPVTAWSLSPQISKDISNLLINSRAYLYAPHIYNRTSEISSSRRNYIKPRLLNPLINAPNHTNRRIIFKQTTYLTKVHIQEIQHLINIFRAFKPWISMFAILDQF